jgi:hypothetical protein
MKYLIFSAVVGFSFVVGSAMAQQPQQSPTATALQIDTIVNQWAQILEAQQHQIQELQKQVDDLKAKYEPPKDQPKK